MHITFLPLLLMKSVVRALKFEYTTETNTTGTVVFLVPFQVSFFYPPLLHIELSNDVPQSPDRFLLPKSVLQKFFFRYLSYAQKKPCKPVLICSLYIYISPTHKRNHLKPYHFIHCTFLNLLSISTFITY